MDLNDQYETIQTRADLAALVDALRQDLGTNPPALESFLEAMAVRIGNSKLMFTEDHLASETRWKTFARILLTARESVDNPRMSFGDPARFAIEYEVYEPPQYLLGGCVRCWIHGREVGEIHYSTYLTDVITTWSRISCDAGKRQNPFLFALSTEALVEVVREVFDSEEENAALIERANDEQWANHIVDSGVDVFGGWTMYLVEDDHTARLLVRFEEEPFQEYALHAGEFDRVLKAALVPLFEMEERALKLRQEQYS